MIFLISWGETGSRFKVSLSVFDLLKQLFADCFSMQSYSGFWFLGSVTALSDYSTSLQFRKDGIAVAAASFETFSIKKVLLLVGGNLFPLYV